MTRATERDARLLEAGRDVVLRLSAVLRACGLYAAENAALTAAAEALRGAVRSALDGGVELEISVRGESLYIAGARIRESLVASTNYQRVVGLLRRAEIHALRIDDGVAAPELILFARLLSEVAAGKRRPADLPPELAVRGVGSLSIERGAASDSTTHEVDAERVAKRIYLRSIGVVKNVFHELRQGDGMAARRVKRVVQEMIESLENDPAYLLNLASLKNYDEYTFNHSVNTSVLAVALGRHVGLERRQLYALGQAGMLHDLGKLCLPLSVLNKPGQLSADERRLVEQHPADGFLTIAAQMGVSGDTLDVALAAYEHHMQESELGYPARETARPKRLLSLIVSIVDCYDAMTSARVYRGEPISPPETLRHMYAGGCSRFDPVLLRSFMNLMGTFPIGTGVLLSDGSVGIVTGGHPDPQLRHLPLVKILVDAEGRRVTPITVDLASTLKDSEPLAISEVVSLARAGVSALEALL